MKRYKGWIDRMFCYDIVAESRGQAYGMLLSKSLELIKKGFRVYQFELIEEKVENKRKREKTEVCEGQLSIMENIGL